MTSTALRDAVTGEKPQSKLAAFSGFMDKFKPQLALALPKHLNVDRMARLAMTAFSTTPHLDECSANSIAGSLMTAGQLGLEPGVNGQGYLIPYFDNKKRTYICTFVPGWKGLVDLVARAGRATVWTGVVMKGDEFDYQLGDSPFCRHKPGDGVDGEWTHVYAIGRVRDAQMPVIEVWTRAKVQKHLKSYNKVGERHYANSSENNFEMYGRKVALLQVLKYVPQSIELATATRIADLSDTGKGVVVVGDFVSLIDEPTGEVPPPPASTPPVAATLAPRPAVKRATGKAQAAQPADATPAEPAPAAARSALTQEALVEYCDQVAKTPRDRDEALQALDLARSELNEADFGVVTAAFHERWDS
jgi:recombination protein RecT